MIRFLGNLTTFTFLYACFAYVLALFASKFLLSSAMIGLILISFLNVEAKSFNQFFKRRDLLAITLLFGLVLITGLYSQNTGEWLNRVRIKLPFLLLPGVFFFLPSIRHRHYRLIFFWLLIVAVLFSCGVLFNFYNNHDEVLQAMHQGRSIPTPVNHIRFGLMIALAVTGGLALLLRKEKIIFKGEKLLIGLCTLGLFIGLHIMAIRSGIATMYLGIAAIILMVLTEKKYRIPALVGILTLISVPVLMYFLSNSFKEKVNYTIWQFQKGVEIPEEGTSDGNRIITYKAGWDIFTKNSLTGVGYGDIKDEMTDWYTVNEFVVGPKLPHNQFLTTLTGAGIIGGILFLLALLIPVILNWSRKNYILIGWLGVMLGSFLFDNTIENSLGVGIFLFYLLLGIHEKHSE